MINKIVGSYLFIALLFALALKLMNVDSQMFGDHLRVLIATSSMQLEDVNFVIPSIPHIPNDLEMLPLQNVEWWQAVLNFFVNFANVFITFLNGIVDVINFVIQVINFMIKLIEFVVIIIRNFFTMRDNIVSSQLA